MDNKFNLKKASLTPHKSPVRGLFLKMGIDIFKIIVYNNNDQGMPKGLPSPRNLFRGIF